MGLWGRIERALWTGAVIKDYGVISERSVRGPRRKLSAVLSERGGVRRVFLKESLRGPLAAAVRYIELDRDEVARLAEILAEASPEMDKIGPAWSP